MSIMGIIDTYDAVPSMVHRALRPSTHSVDEREMMADAFLHHLWGVYATAVTAEREVHSSIALIDESLKDCDPANPLVDVLKTIRGALAH